MLVQTLCDRLAQLIVETRKHSCLVLVEAMVSKLSDSLAVVTHRPAVVELKTHAEKLAIMDARRWSIHWRADKQRERCKLLARLLLRWRLTRQWTHCSRHVKKHLAKLSPRRSSTNWLGKNRSRG